MKVCTDACLFGAWVAETISGCSATARVLDVGAGTGLLSLMVAQKTAAFIDAIEIDKAAAMQAAENFEGSPWNDRLKLEHRALQDFCPISKYDYIISNPPFYENDLKSDSTAINAARHDITLTMDTLVAYISNYLADTGKAFLLMPFHRTAEVEALALEKKLRVVEKVLVRQTPAHNFFRTILTLSNQSATACTAEISVHDMTRNYGPEFSELLADYYMKL